MIISCVAELGRSPFDLIEAESELVAGQMTEYSSIIFAYFFLAEYANKLFMGIFLSLLFFGLFTPLPFLFLLIWLRASLPRIRIDHKLSLGWNHLLPLLTGFVIFFPGLIINL